MDKSGFVYPGTVFTAKNYDPFTKKVLAHPFVCVYDQALDPNLSGETNILALLITSNNKQLVRQVPVIKAKNPFLEKDSFCYCNNIYMFLKQDINVIGQLDSDTFFDIVQKRQLLLRGENDQCVQALMNMKAYEYKMKQKAREDKRREKELEEARKSNSCRLVAEQPPASGHNAPQHIPYRHNNSISNGREENRMMKPAGLPPSLPGADNKAEQPPIPNQRPARKHFFFRKKNSGTPKSANPQPKAK